MLLLDPMPDESITRKLTAILYADVAGYSRLTGTDEVGTHKQLSAALNLISGRIEEAGGRVVHYAGDAVLAEFQSVVKAVETAVGIQRRLAEDGAGIADDKRLRFRIGVNLGEVIVDRDDIYGDGVNVAARLESLAEPGGVNVSGAVYEQVNGKLDVGFEDMGAQEVKNIAQPIHVYRILSSVPAPSADGEEAAAAGKTAAPKPAVAEKPSIAVLPFDNMSADPEQEFFADGLTEDILTQLSRFSGLLVISRTSTFAYKGKSVTARDVARELGVRYVVEGSVRKAGNRVRVTVQLIDGTNDRHVWAERYDRDLEDIFAIQDAITAAITATLPGRIEADSHDRARQIPTDNMQAYECVLTGKVLHHRSNRDDNKEALRLLERAIALDPGYAHARAWRACVLGQSWVHGWIDGDQDVLTREIEAELERALALDENDADTHRILAAINITRHDFERALVHQEKALRLNPNYDLVVVQYGELMTWLGRAEEDIEWIQKAMQINPFHPQRFWSHLGRAFFVARRYRDAIDAFRHIEKNIPMNLAFVAASFAYLDDDAEAAAHGREVLKLSPDFNISEHMTTQHHAQDSDRAHHSEGLLKAGLPAG